MMVLLALHRPRKSNENHPRDQKDAHYDSDAQQHPLIPHVERIEKRIWIPLHHRATDQGIHQIRRRKYYPLDTILTCDDTR